MTPDQRVIVQQLVEAFARELSVGLAPTLAEGHLKVVGFEGLLRAGFTLREGSHDSAKDKLIVLRDGVPTVSRITRERATAVPGLGMSWNTVDLRVVEPVRLGVLLKSACVLGNLDTLEHKLIRKDVEHVRRGGADVLVIAASRRLYDNLRGDKRDSRGRKAADPAHFRELFPPSDSLRRWGDPDLPAQPASSWHGFLVDGPGRDERVVMAWWSGFATQSSNSSESANAAI